jgi:hypothetical protein
MEVYAGRTFPLYNTSHMRPLLWYLLIHDTVSHIYIQRNTALYVGQDFYVDREACLHNKCVMLPNKIKRVTTHNCIVHGLKYILNHISDS